jgi:hypothetical protein
MKAFELHLRRADQSRIVATDGATAWLAMLDTDEVDRQAHNDRRATVWLSLGGR